jgi:hypothetical protein
LAFDMKTSFPAPVVLAHVALALNATSLGAQRVNLWSLKQASVAAFKTERLATTPSAWTCVAQTFTQPLGHLVKNSSPWQQRLWIGIRHYNLSHAGRSGDGVCSG